MTIPPIPAAAMPVVEAIRREVPRPKQLPKPGPRAEHGERAFLRFGAACPMGLLPGARTPCPSSRDELYWFELTSHSIVAFYHWWDAQTDARAAMDLVWGRSR